MAQQNSTTKRPAWPYPDAAINVTIDGKQKTYKSQMTAHPRGYWVKRIPGTNKLWWGDRWDEPEKTLERWRAEWPCLVRGDRSPSRGVRFSGAVRVGDLVNGWYRAKEAVCGVGELQAVTLRKYRRIGLLFGNHIGERRLVDSLTSADFLKLWQFLGKYKLTGRSDYITHIRGIFRWGVLSGMIDREPIYGPEFVTPKSATKRRYRHEKGDQTIPADDIRYMYVHADIHMRAVILLGINAGLKSMDIATLDSLLDLDSGVLSGIRRKTSTDIYAPLWPETVRAIRRAACASGPILQWRGRLPWNGEGTDRVGREFKAFRESLGLPGYTHGQLRHTFRTIGGEVDRDAARRVMGQRFGDVLDETYDHSKMHARTQRVVDHVRWWLFTS